MLKLTAGALFAVLFFAACSPRLTPLTEQLYDDFRWDESELSRIQFYLSDDLVMRRQLSAGSSEILSGGKIRIENGRRVEVVTIQRGTPGVFLRRGSKGDHFAVSFESDDKYLMFGPNPKAGDRFVILGSDWSRNGGMVTYGGQKFRVDRTDAFAGLLVNLKKIQKTERQSRVARGRTVGN